MSLLEDVFLLDEAGEAQELERIIEGDEYEERAKDDPDSNENSEREDEAEEDKRRVDPSSTKTKSVVKNPRFVLNPARLTGPRGISVIPEHFKDLKFKGKGHEKEDLDLILKKLEHWAYRLYPKFKFEDCLKKIETLGKKRAVAVHLTKIRSDQLVTDDTVVQKDSSDEEELAAPLPEEDEFDQLLQQQIELARATPGPGEARPGFNTPHVDKRSPFMVPKATSSPSISDEQKERMIRNRKLAEERRLARLRAATLTENSNTVSTIDLINGNIDGNNSASNENAITNGHNGNSTKRNRSNVIDSSDEDGDLTINEEVSVDIHNTNKNMIDLTEMQRPESVTSNDVELVITGVPNKNVMNSDEGMNDAVTLDGLKSSNQKKNRSNMIDSSDEDGELTINEELSVDIHNTNEHMIDRTEIQRPKCVTSYDVELVIAGTPNKKKKIINSDDDNEGMNEAITLDTLKSTNQKYIDLTDLQIPKRIAGNDIDLVITGDPNNKKHVIVSDDEEINPVMTANVDNKNVTEGYSRQKSHNSHETESRKNNILDSSDEEDISVVREAIVVDIHQKINNVEQVIINSKNEKANTTDIILNCNNMTNVHDKTNKVSYKVHTEINNKVQNKDEFETQKVDNNLKATKNSDAISMTDDDANEKTKNTNLDTDKEDVDNNTSKDNEALDELMDVDFSEDF